MIDIVGLNFYPDNQWHYEGGTIPLGHYEYRALSQMLAEAHQRFQKPVLVTETGAEGSARPAWLHYVCGEVRQAMAAGVPVVGVCLYPVTAYPHWDDFRPVEVGLFTTTDSEGERKLYQPLADELERQQRLFEAE
jgi:hypothetical protein